MSASNKIGKSSSITGKRHYSTNRDFTNSKIVTKFISDKIIEPVYVYEDLDQSITKNNILKDTRGLSGIYLILNKVTLDYYIGSASTNRIYKRFSSHMINYTGSKVLKNAVKKYKLSSFAFLVLEIFPEIVTQKNNSNLLDLEDFYLKSLLPNYNILTEAGSSFGYKHSELTRIKMKTNYSQERRDAIGALNRNKKLSDATIALLREKALNRIKPVYSEQALKNMKKKSKPIIVYNLDHTVYGRYPSVIDTAKGFNCSVKTVYRALKSKDRLLKKS
jgi:group I intron endonuclease